MKSLKEFQNSKLSVKEMRCVVGGDSSCTYSEDTQKGTCSDVAYSLYDDSGTLISQGEQVVHCEPSTETAEINNNNQQNNLLQQNFSLSNLLTTSKLLPYGKIA